MNALIYPTVWLLGLMLAPHTLGLLGNLAGELQWLLPVVLAAGMVIYWLNSNSLRHLTETSAEPVYELEALSRELGFLPSAILFFGGRFITAIAVATVLLVTAGFVFNETFVYWFPNFAFAFVLLGLVMAVHLFGQLAARRFQLVLIALALTGIVALSLMGLVGNPPPVAQADGSTEGIAIRPFFAVLMLFVGFDLAANQKANPGIIHSKPMIAGLLVAAMTFAMWAVVSMQYVPAHRLADTFIAHTMAARAIGGQSGRMIMGVVIIAGACAAVNALFWNQSRSLSQLTARWTGAPPIMRWVKHPAAGSLISGVIVAAMMAEGMAGTDEIDTYVRTGIYFWMLYYAGVHLGVLLRGRRDQNAISATAFRLALMGGVLMTCGSAVLMATDPESALVLKAALAVAVSIAALSMIDRIWRRRISLKGNEY